MSSSEINDLDSNSNSSKYSSSGESFDNEIHPEYCQKNQNNDFKEIDNILNLNKVNPETTERVMLNEISPLKKLDDNIISKNRRISENKKKSEQNELNKEKDKDDQQNDNKNELSSIYFQIDLATNTMDLKEVQKAKRKENVYDRLYYLNQNKNIRFSPPNKSKCKKISNRSFQVEQLESNRADNKHEDSKISPRINKLYSDAKVIATKLNQRRNQIDQKIMLMSNVSNTSSNTEQLAKNKIQKEVEKIYKMYQQKLGGIHTESLFKSFLYDLGLIQTLNPNSKHELKLI